MKMRTGCVYLDKSFKYYRRGVGYCQRNEWRGEIEVYGKRYRCRSHSRAQVEAWVADMVHRFPYVESYPERTARKAKERRTDNE